MKIYFIRHGESEANITMAYNSRNYKIHPLTEIGKKQIESGIEIIENIKFDEYYSSPILRAIESSEIISKKIKKEYIVAEEIKEIDMGIFEGEKGKIADDAYRKMLNEWILNRCYDKKIENGESFYDVEKRFEIFLGKISKESKNVLVVSHAGFIRAIFSKYAENFSLGYTFYNKINNGKIAILDLDKKEGLLWNNKEI